MSLGHLAMLAAGHPSVILDGYPVGENGDRAFCSGCRRELRAGHRATVLAYRCAETNRWDVPGAFCDVCAPTSIDEQTENVVEILAAGDLVLGESMNGDPARLHLAEIDVLDHSGTGRDRA